MTHVDLFSGIGGFAIAARWTGFETVCFSEVDPFCCALLAERFPGTPNVGDIRTTDWSTYRGATLVTGGFPCQPFSLAGKRKGKTDDRHLWPAMLAAIETIRPAWVLGENVAGLIPMGLDGVLSDLEGIGYACRAFVIPAVAVGAQHRRHRVWIVANDASERGGMVPEVRRESPAHARWNGEGIVAHAGGDGRQQVTGSAHGDEGADEGRASLHTDKPTGHGEGCCAWSLADAEERTERPRLRSGEPGGELWRRLGDGGCAAAPDSVCSRLEERQGVSGDDGEERDASERDDRDDFCWWLPEPDIRRVSHGIPARVDRLRGLGNAIVPQVAAEIMRAIALAEEGG